MSKIKAVQETKATVIEAEALRRVRTKNKTDEDLLNYLFFGEKVHEPAGPMAGSSKTRL